MLKISLNENNLYNTDCTYVIDLDPTNYNHHTKNPLELREK